MEDRPRGLSRLLDTWSGERSFACLIQNRGLKNKLVLLVYAIAESSW
jgi:hypothetical protein